MFKNRFVRWAFFLLIGACIGMLIGLYQAQDELNDGVIALSPDDQAVATILKQPESRPNENAKKPDIGGPFTLVDHTGTDVTEADFDGQYKLIFFGFTYCPAICPTELQKVNLILEDLGEAAADITPILITIDPERDTVEQMAQYVEQFNPRLVGLTGTQEQIDAAAAAYKVYAVRVENEMMAEYMMDHSTFLYFMGPDGEFLSMYPSTDTAQQIAEHIREVMP